MVGGSRISSLGGLPGPLPVLDGGVERKLARQSRLAGATGLQAGRSVMEQADSTGKNRPSFRIVYGETGGGEVAAVGWKAANRLGRQKVPAVDVLAYLVDGDSSCLTFVIATVL